MDELQLMVDDSDGDHRFRVYQWDNSDNWRTEIIETVGEKVREIYAGYEELKDIVAGDDSDLGFDMTRVEESLSKILENAVPRGEDGGVVSTPRSDFPEIIASICLERLHGTIIPVDIVEKRDTLTNPGRGVDVLGYEEVGGDIHLILCEVKSSSEDNSPPQVVTGGDLALDEQLKGLVLNQEKITKDLMLIFRKAKIREQKEKLGQLLISIQDSPRDTNIILCPFLVRELDKYQEADYLPLKDGATDFEPYTLRFLAVCLDDNITKLSEDIFDFAVQGDGA